MCSSLGDEIDSNELIGTNMRQIHQGTFLNCQQEKTGNDDDQTKMTVMS